MTNTIYISLSENNAALSAYSVINGYLFVIVDQVTYQFSSNYYTNTIQCLDNLSDDENFISNLAVISGGTFADYTDGYFNYYRYYNVVNSGYISEFDTVVFNLTGVQDTTFNITKITLDKFGDNSVLISKVKNFYLTYDNASALAIAEETNTYTSPKYDLIETTYQTVNSAFTTTYTPVLSVFRDNGVIDIINVTLTVAKQSFIDITQNFRVIDTYQFNNKVIIKMQNPVNNQIYFTSLSAG